MARTGPKLSPNPGKTARYYRRNKKARLKHRRTNRKINSTPQKRAYRRDLMRIRRKRKPGPQTDMSHKGGKIVAENRKANRRRGATQEKSKKMSTPRRIRRLPGRRRPPGVKGPGPKKQIGRPRPPRPPRGPRPPRPPRHGRPPRPPRPGGPRPPRPGFGRPTRPRPPRRPVRPPRRPVRPPRRPVRPPRPPRRRPPIRRRPPRRPPRRRFPGRRPPRRHTGIR